MPRKSESVPPPAQAASEAPSPSSKAQDKKDKTDKEPVTIEDLSLPRSIITRLAKGILPPNTQIQGNAILALSKSATVFISYLAAHANENTVAAGKKTVAPADVLKALDDTEFGFLKERLEAEFKKFSAIQTEKRTTYRQKVKAAKSAGDDTDMADASADPDDPAASRAADAGPRAAKKQRLDNEDEHDDDDDDEDQDDQDEDDEEEVEDEEEEEEEDEDEAEGYEDGRASADETRDAMEERRRGADEADEALDGDESD
ncbi:DNA polymerase epsilon subunit D [Escovopsis weberi]|uniref:DNA polymerase epsilon subunit D n=1 Tax=Escovopsis weberi TaxID=150374 RepID=A0A0M8N5F4_ESCWE|nr:DNA polymerase epsilon subunit D [Escovopsis weberi]